jgi:signal transduction histidine kinase
VSTPGVVRHISPFSAALNALGLERTVARATDAPDAQAVLETFRISETFRWLRRWAVVAVIAIVTPLTVVDAWANDMPVFHHVAVPLAVAIIVPAWVVELSGVRWPRIALIAATVLPNVWLTLIGHNTTNYLWLPLLVAWVGFAGTRGEGMLALLLSVATIALDVMLYPAVSWSYWFGWLVILLFAWFMGLVLRRQVVLVAELRLLREQAEARARQMAVLEERQRLSRELHDSVTQSLYGISLYTAAATRALQAGDTEPAAANLAEISQTSHEALGELRLVLFELRPPVLQEHGLAAALSARLQTVEARSGLSTAFALEGDARLAPDEEQELYGLAQEALNNVVKHAHAAHVSVRLSLAPAATVLDVVDDGAGFDPCDGQTHGLGLRGMRERAERLGGTLCVESSPGHGTRVRVEVPR